MSRKKSILLTLVLSCIFCMAAENLFPPFKVVKDGEPGGWYTNRTVEVEAKYGMDVKSKILKLDTKGSGGYADWRVMQSFKPGVYTIVARVTGKGAGLTVNAYSFKKGTNPQFILNQIINGSATDRLVVKTFTIPAGSEKVRIGFTSSNTGSWTVSEPALYAGAHTAKSLNLSVSTAPVYEAPELTSWVAKWVWVKREFCDDTPKASIIKEITLEAAPTYAVVQLTADNGYRFMVNGKLVGADGDWKTIETYEITDFLKPGKNVIELEGENYDSVGGIILQGAIFPKGGKPIYLKSDEGFRFVINGKPAQDKMQVFEKGAWGILPFKPMMPPVVKRFPVKNLTTAVKGGDTFSLAFNPTCSIPASELEKLTLRFFNAQGREVVLSSANNTVIRYQKEVNLLLAEAQLSPYAMPGTYTWKVEGLTWEIAGDGASNKVAVTAGDIPKVAAGTRFPKPDGTNFFTTANGVKTGRFTYSTYTRTPQHYRNWHYTGGHLYEVFVQSGAQGEDVWIDLTDTERNMMQILEADPAASIVVKLRVDVPGWWGAKYPKETFKSSKGGRGGLQSFASLVWRQQMGDLMVNVMKSLAARPAGKALSGILIMGFRGGEFQLWGEDVGEYDCSEPAVKAFDEWQKAHGLKQKIALPHPALAFPFQKGPGYEQIRKTYFTFLAERHAENLIWFADYFDKAFHGQYTFGCYYGYPMEYGGNAKRMLFSGHLGAAIFLKKAKIDYISCPASYSLRRQPLSHAYMNPADSAILRGITPILENDVRNFVNPGVGDGSGQNIFSMRDSIIDIQRMDAFSRAHGGAIRYLALSGTVDWFQPLPVIDTIAKDNQLCMTERPAKLGNPEQVALAITPDDWVGVGDLPTDCKFGDFSSKARDTVMRTGRSVAFVILDDVLTPVKNVKWKRVAVLLPGLLSKDKLAKLEKMYGKLPPIQHGTGVLILRPEGNVTANTSQDFWAALATPQAKAAGFGTVWYVGDNFTYTWNGKEFKKK